MYMNKIETDGGGHLASFLILFFSDEQYTLTQKNPIS